MAGVSQIGYKIEYKRSQSTIRLFVDGIDLLDILEEAHDTLVPKESWLEKRDAVVALKEVKKSIKKSGRFDFLVCWHCKVPDDIALREFQVEHDGEYVHWEVAPPGAEFYIEEYELLRFSFDKSQYVKTLKNLVEDNMMGKPLPKT